MTTYAATLVEVTPDGARHPLAKFVNRADAEALDRLLTKKNGPRAATRLQVVDGDLDEAPDLEGPTAPATTWVFRWASGGYNSVRACGRADALAKATALGAPSVSGWRGAPDPATLRPDPTGALLNELDREFRSLCD